MSQQTYSRVCIGRLLSIFPIHCGLKPKDAPSPLVFNFSLVYIIRRVQENIIGLELNGKRQLIIYAGDVNKLGANLKTVR